MTVEEMLAKMSSREYARWVAFERTNGPVGGYQMQQEVLSSIQEQLQLLTYLFSQANFTSEDNRKGPVDPPQRYPRPYDLPSDAKKSDDELDFSDEWLPPVGESTCPPDCRCNGGDKKPTTHF